MSMYVWKNRTECNGHDEFGLSEFIGADEPFYFRNQKNKKQEQLIDGSRNSRTKSNRYEYVVQRNKTMNRLIVTEHQCEVL